MRSDLLYSVTAKSENVERKWDDLIAEDNSKIVL